MTFLLVRLRLVGDVVFTTPAIRALRERFPTARLLYLVEPAAAPIVAHSPYLDDVIVAPRARGWRRLRDDLRMARRLHAARVDVAVDMHGGPRSAWFTWATRAPVRVGYDVPGRAWMYTRRVHRPRELRRRHSVENQWDLLRAIDPAFDAGPDRARYRTEMFVDARARREIDARLASAGVPQGRRVIVLHVSAGNPFRRWPEAAWAELAADLVARDADRWLVLTGGPSDRDAAARVMRDAGERAGAARSRLVDGDGLSLEALRALMDRASLFVGGDSGPLHVASTSDVPIVGLYGPTLPERSAPWRPDSVPSAAVDVGELPCRPCDQRVCAPGDFRCLTSLRAARVRDEAERLLKGSR